MSNVRQALAELKNAVDRLESAAGGVQAVLAGKQREMFAPAPPNGDAQGPDSAAFAQRLDSAIKKVEELMGG